MTVIPNFILKRMYKAGTLRKIDGGVAFDIVNNMGPGQISRLNSISLNGTKYGPEVISLKINDEDVPAVGITEDNPATFFLNQVISCIIRAEDVVPGKVEIVLDLISREAGKVVLSVEDQLAA